MSQLNFTHSASQCIIYPKETSELKGIQRMRSGTLRGYLDIDRVATKSDNAIWEKRKANESPNTITKIK